MKSLEIILAGGQGSRLGHLTGDIPKPLVPFGGDGIKILDFVLSNAFNSGSRHLLVLTQYQAEHLEDYIDSEWKNLLQDAGTSIKSLRSKTGRQYTGTANAVYQNRRQIQNLKPNLVGILSADHIYSMDYRQMYETHLQQDADLTVTAMPVPLAEARRFGVLEVDVYGKVVGFHEKPQEPKHIPTNPDMCWANLGIYAFKPKVLLQMLGEDARDPNSNHDFGKNIIPEMINRGMKVIVYNFHMNKVEGVSSPYWADVGIPDEYHRVHMDLVGKNPKFNVRNLSWPLHIADRQTEQPAIDKNAEIEYSIVSPGATVGESRVVNSVIFPGVQIEDYAEITDSVVLPKARIGKFARLSKTIVNRGAHVPNDLKVGLFETLNQRLGLTRTDGGVYVVGVTLDGYKT